MVKDEQKWIRLFEKYKKDELAGRLRFQLADLENFIKARLGGATAYQAAGGYQNLYQLLKKLEIEEQIRAIKNSDFNQRQPRLKKRWTLLKEEVKGWSDKEILKLSRQLDLNYYLKRPVQQTAELKQKLFSLADFLKTKSEREWASREERSLELFADEKFLSRTAGKKLLSNLNLSLADLKAQQYNHLFVYWAVDPTSINNILIMENHSAFIGAKKALAAGIDIFARDFDTVIYGQGKRIIRSFSFLEELLGLEAADDNFRQRQRRLEALNICYAGDLDPEGLAIYTGLKNKYPDFKIRLLGEYYQLLLEESDNFYPYHKRQNKNQKIMAEVVNEFEEQGYNELAAELQRAWENNLRLPQELLTLEVYKKCFAEEERLDEIED
ncbi:Wadjet anti-phage system protein JetD domain-containing protein [Halanaerobium saccharolyticum]|uniref:Wadjet anti-phage system protein JetD domain-containing protein n=1 Tax=Halanaerobium saccharolyticum TaxID=43595 RepID=UPI003FCEB08F